MLATTQALEVMVYKQMIMKSIQLVIKAHFLHGKDKLFHIGKKCISGTMIRVLRVLLNVLTSLTSNAKVYVKHYYMFIHQKNII